MVDQATGYCEQQFKEVEAITERIRKLKKELESLYASQEAAEEGK